MTLSHMEPIRVRLLGLGLSKGDTSLILKDLERWISNSGMEWTIERLKALRSAYIQFIGGNPYELPWLSNRKQNGILTPKGVWGKFWTRDETRVPIVLKVLHLYSYFTLTKVTAKQKKKFLDSVWAMPNLRIDHLLKEGVADYACLHSFGAKPYRRSLIASVNSLPPEHRKKFPRDFGRAVHYMTIHNRWFPEVTKSWGGFDRWFLNNRLKDGPEGPPLVGNLGISQERGGKLRVFAFPNLLFQTMMNPLKASLFRILRKIPEDCTYDQQSGVRWVEEKLRAGHCAWSVDLSDATNHCSFELQKLVLLNIFRHPAWENHIELFEMVSKGRYGAAAIGGKHVTWTKGQPLGAGPSFALFAITHHAILHFCKVVENERNTDCYRILGDDIVITNEAVATRYFKVLEHLLIPVSRAKSVTSKDVAEFAGVVIHRTLGGIPSTKWKSELNLGNVTSESVYYGVKAARFLPHHWRTWYLEWYSVFQKNSLGLTRDERLNRKVAVLQRQEERRLKQTILKERATARSLYWQILQDLPVDSFSSAPPDLEGAVSPDEPFGFSPVEELVASLSASLHGPSRYAVRDRKIFNKPFGGELRSYRQAVRTLHRK